MTAPQQVTLGDFSCVYEQTGDGPDIVLLHSIGLSTREGWRYQVPELARHFRVLTFDFRGLGQSGRGAARLGVATFVADIRSLLDRLHVRQTAVMGVSLGGAVAQAFALAHPDRLSALVLVSTTPGHIAANAARRAERNARVREFGMVALAGPQIANQFMPDFAAAHPDIMGWYTSHYLANDPGAYADVLDDLGRVDFSGRLGDIRCPTLIVGGDSDTSVVAGQHPLDSPLRLRALIPHANLAIIPNAKHYPQIDHPELFNACVIEFLRRHLAPPA